MNIHPDFIHFSLLLLLKHAIIDYLRKKKRTDAQMQEEFDCHFFAEDQYQFLDEELEQSISNFFQENLTQKEFQVMSLIIQENKEIEVAEILNFPKNTISTLVRRSRTKLKRHRSQILKVCF